VCTVACSERSECSSFPVAECVQSKACAEAAHCDVSCVSDVDCTALSAAHACVAGTCRAASTDEPQSCPHGEVAANQVLLIGDSFFASSHQVTAYLEELARSNGALSAGERYRDNSRLVGNALALGGNGILAQYTEAAEEAPARVVIMNGGGADVLLGSCDVADSSCPTLVAAATAAEELFAKLADDGVEHVVYAFYPDPEDAAVRARMDAFRPLAESACAESPVPCEWLDLRRVFDMKYMDYIGNDGLNPTAEGSRASATAIWQVMQSRCLAQ
jgi:hypothetical protein